ncbi:MAG: polysaccharide export protein EpsE [Bacteroidia bacterium]|nr:polysaccharide export protein EpsE [Bacteroidia bacterium]
MFKTPSNYDYKVDQTISNIEYKLAPNDIIEFSVFTNDGFKLVDLTTAATSVSESRAGGGARPSSIEFTIEPDGRVKLPIIGKVKIDGYTVPDAEKFLEGQYATYYNNPFVMLRVMNKRVLVFPGSGGSGTVINIANNNTTLIEALALAGGITETGKAHKIKLIKGDHRNPEVHVIDLSTIEGMTKSNMLLQANDIIYVEPAPKFTQRILAEITPIVGIITSAFLIYSIIDQP